MKCSAISIRIKKIGFWDEFEIDIYKKGIHPSKTIDYLEFLKIPNGIDENNNFWIVQLGKEKWQIGKWTQYYIVQRGKKHASIISHDIHEREDQKRTNKAGMRMFSYIAHLRNSIKKESNLVEKISLKQKLHFIDMDKFTSIIRQYCQHLKKSSP